MDPVDKQLSPFAAFQTGSDAGVTTGMNAQERLDAITTQIAGEKMALTVNVGDITLTAGQLQGLRVGQQLSFDQDPGSRVLLQVGDQVVAAGVLIIVDGAVGVQIEHLGGVNG